MTTLLFLGANFLTTYTYDAFNHLTNVTMTRPEGTQTRTFQYNGLDLVSTTNPENGTVTYTYDASHKVLTRTDAKNQQTQYTYDQYGRVTQVLHGVVSNGVFTADNSQTWTFAYDTNIRLSQTNTYGRLAAVTVGSSQIYGSGITYEYNYSQGGRVFQQYMHVEQILPQAIDVYKGYGWNLEGRLTSSGDSLGSGYGSPTSGYSYQYDSMGRLNTLLQIAYPSGVQSTLATATYGPANEMTSLSYGGYNETRTYNNLLQLTRQTIPGVFDTEYVFPTGQDNGRIASSIDHITGDQVNYIYDALERLTHAETVSSAWGQTYAFDGFGNLTAKTVTKGSGSNWAQAYDPATNHMTGNPLITYDPNGNIIDQNLQQTYDVENRVTTENIDIGPTSHPTWYYDASGKRVVQIETLPNGNKPWTLYCYDIFGKVYATLTGDSYSTNVPTRNVYFGDRLIQSNGAWVVTDRLGSVRANSNGETFSYLPYGEERTPTANARIKFGTYFRDSTTYNQDYADQRYYNPWYGRFNTPDPAGLQAVNPANPISWDRYLYAGGDPVNFNDATGLTDVVIGGITNAPGDNSIDEFASSIHAIEAFPFSGGSTIGGLLAVGGLTLQQYTQAQTVVKAIEAAAADSDSPINVFAFSGGATTFSDALQLLPADVVSRINNVVYASPGIVGDLPTVNGKTPTVIYGTGPIDQAVTSTAAFPSGTNIIHSNCVGHSASCEFAYAADQAGTPCNQCSAFSAPNLGVFDQLWAAAVASAYVAVWGPGSPPYGNASWQGLDILGFIPTIEQVTSTVTFH